jgi:hypothetical protein
MSSARRGPRSTSSRIKGGSAAVLEALAGAGGQPPLQAVHGHDRDGLLQGTAARRPGRGRHAGGLGRLERLDRWADGVDVAELSLLACTIKAWQAEILAWHATRAAPTGPPTPSTCSSRRSSGSGTASATSPTTGPGCYCTAASGGRLTQPQDCEAAPHAWWRRAAFHRRVVRLVPCRPQLGTTEAAVCKARGR